jgi:hypothetical protein
MLGEARRLHPSIKWLYQLAMTIGVAAIIASSTAAALNKSLPYRILADDYSKYLWVGRLAVASVGLAIAALLSGLAARKASLPIVLALAGLSPLLLLGGVHSGRNPQAWCFLNLRQIEGAKEQLARERALTNAAPVTPMDISHFLPEGRQPRCASGGTYRINPIGTEPRCTLHGTITEIEAAWHRQQAQLGAAAQTQPSH